MNNSSNQYYSDPDYKYTEIGIALNDFVYGGKVQISIPTLTPFMNNNNAIDNKERVNTVNIINADIEALHISKADKVTVSNNFTLTVPYYLADYERSPFEHAETDSDGDSTPAQKHTDFIRLKWNGVKGTRFIVAFVGGSSENPRIIGRMDW